MGIYKALRADLKVSLGIERKRDLSVHFLSKRKDGELDKVGEGPGAEDFEGIHLIWRREATAGNASAFADYG